MKNHDFQANYSQGKAINGHKRLFMAVEGLTLTIFCTGILGFLEYPRIS